MTEISIDDLLGIIKAHPSYMEKWHDEVSANLALYIRFNSDESKKLNSLSYSAVNGNEIILDVDNNGIVHGIEII